MEVQSLFGSEFRKRAAFIAMVRFHIQVLCAPENLLLRFPFDREQFLFSFQTPAISVEFAITADYAMTGDDHGDRILATSPGDGTHRCRLANLFSNLPIGTRLSSGNLLQSIPDTPLKRRAPHIERKLPPPGCFLQLRQYLRKLRCKHAIVAPQLSAGKIPLQIAAEFGVCGRKRHCAQAAFGGCNQNSSQRRVRCGVRDLLAIAMSLVAAGSHAQNFCGLFVQATR